MGGWRKKEIGLEEFKMKEEVEKRGQRKECKMEEEGERWSTETRRTSRREDKGEERRKQEEGRKRK